METEVTRYGFHTESRMRENCTYGSMRGRAYPAGASRSTLHPSVYVSLYMFDCGEAELAAHECAKGTKVFEVNYGTDVEVILASLATERLAKRAYCISARR